MRTRNQAYDDPVNSKRVHVLMATFGHFYLKTLVKILKRPLFGVLNLYLLYQYTAKSLRRSKVPFTSAKIILVLGSSERDIFLAFSLHATDDPSSM